LRKQSYGCAASGRRLYRPHPQGRQAGGFAGGAGEQVRAGDQPPDSPDARAHRAGQAARCRRRGDRVKRRAFITLLGGATAWPLAARGQQSERMRRIGVFMPLAADDPESLARVGAFLQGLQALGWTDGRNVRIDYRWAAGDAERIRKYAAELAAL